MKNAIVLLEKGDVLVRTKHLDAHTVQWTDGEKPLCDLLSDGYTIRDNTINAALSKLEDVRDSLCWGRKPNQKELLEIIDILRNY